MGIQFKDTHSNINNTHSNTHSNIHSNISSNIRSNIHNGKIKTWEHMVPLCTILRCQTVLNTHKETFISQTLTMLQKKKVHTLEHGKESFQKRNDQIIDFKIFSLPKKNLKWNYALYIFRKDAELNKNNRNQRIWTILLCFHTPLISSPLIAMNFPFPFTLSFSNYPS